MKNKKIIILFIVIMISAVIFSIYKYSKYYIFIKIVDTEKDIRTSSNFYYEIKNTGKTIHTSSKIWVKGDKIKYQIFNDQGIIQTMYVDLTENKTYLVSEATMTYTILDSSLMRASFSNFPNSLLTESSGENEKTFFDIIFSIKELKIETINGVECYKISYKDDLINETVWVNKETLLPIKVEDNNDNGLKANYEIELNNVTDEDVSFLNIDDYNFMDK